MRLVCMRLIWMCSVLHALSCACRYVFFMLAGLGTMGSTFSASSVTPFFSNLGNKSNMGATCSTCVPCLFQRFHPYCTLPPSALSPLPPRLVQYMRTLPLSPRFSLSTPLHPSPPLLHPACRSHHEHQFDVQLWRTGPRPSLIWHPLLDQHPLPISGAPHTLGPPLFGILYSINIHFPYRVRPIPY